MSRMSMLMGRGTLLDRDGHVVHQDPWTEARIIPSLRDLWMPNALADEGEASVLNTWLKASSNPTKYMALLNQASPGDTTTMATMTEADTPGTHGYNRQLVDTTDWGSTALSSGDEQTTAAEKTFGAVTGTSITLTHVVLVTTSTGTAGLFLVYIAAAATTVIAVGQSYKYTLSQKAA